MCNHCVLVRLINTRISYLPECKYDVISNECNTETNKMVKVMRLQEGLDETKCEKEITMEKRKCKNKGRCLHRE